MSEDHQLPEDMGTWLQKLDLGSGATRSLADAMGKDQVLRGFSISALALMLSTRNDLAIKAFTGRGVPPLVVEALIAKLQHGAAAGLGSGSTGADSAAFGAPQSALEVPLPQLVGDVPFLHVNRLLDKAGGTIGTCFRLQGDLVLTARHCVVDNGCCLDGLSAFGGDLTFVAASPELDMVVFRGPSRPSGPPSAGFKLMGGQLYLGRPVSLLSFPQAYDKELGLAGDSSPALDNGVVSQVSMTGKHALATFGTGMPNSSGGPVVSATGTLAGLYVGTVWHLQGLDSSSPSSGSSGSCSGGRSTSSGGGAVRPPAGLEWDSTAMWEDDEVDEVETAAANETSTAARLSCVNIAHKSSAAIFVTAAAILTFLQAAGLAGDDPLDTDVARTARRKRGFRR